ncbi:Binding--dependent transport system inner membrane component family protein (plasmid) [Neorhizobium galegae bv. officinalis bv. officinalis str. HAMBI 1141]|uniref:Binding--dependent transport system inner membrane component family protein n=1 Tax=Neorhizobium galegae bv. officinalis bv. officinalis str. HAMBI 1141 TaxID=1028801 RepID=A0A068TGS7_NEOGA|nr:iron ABC transporter permease [Neorhizobium galegae]CDN57652.1 Binding--dependent transport system inner membrane component family protein [Neorhizobium galegae bv. officinalis bv. officinalis str. HAMBI 1141]
MNRAAVVERVAYWIGLAALIWIVMTFLILPLLASLHAAFFKDGSLVFGQVVSELSRSRRVRAALWNTVWMTSATMVTVTVVGLFQVLVLEYFHVRGRAFLKIIYATPLVFGGVVAAAGYNFTYGPGGAVTHLVKAIFPSLPQDWFIGWFGVLFTHTFLMTTFYYLFLRAAMRRVDYAIIEAARSMGASEYTVLRRVVLPTITPSLLAVALLTLYTAISSFAAPQVLGGRDFHMLSQMVLTLNSLRRPDMAAFLALMMGLCLMGLILLSQYYEARASDVGGAKATAAIRLRKIRSPVANGVLHFFAYLLVAIYVVPISLVVLFSFAPAASIGIEVIPSSLTLKNYARVFTEGSAFLPFFNSIVMSLVAVTVALGVTLFAVPVILGRRSWLTRFLDIAFFLPWVVPSILLAVGLIVTFDTPNPFVGNAVLLGSYWLLPIAYAIVALPLMVRFLRAAFMGIDPAYNEAARSMGAAGLYRYRRIILPIVAPTAILVAGMAFNDLLSEYPLSAFLYNVNNKPLPIAIVDSSLSVDPEQAALNLVYVTLIMAFSMAIILLAERIGLGKGPETTTL